VHTVRREAFVDAAMRLVQLRGYEQTSIQDVLDELDASRGAFYHYFDSKQELLEAMVDRIADQALASLGPIVEDGRLPANLKLERFFSGIGQWKTDRKALMLELIKVWLSDDNAIVREKVRRVMVERIAPILADIIRQGIAEEVFVAESPEETAWVLMTLLQGFQDTATGLYVGRQNGTVSYDDVQRRLQGFTHAFERVLGAPPGSVKPIDENIMREWFG